MSDARDRNRIHRFPCHAVVLANTTLRSGEGFIIITTVALNTTIFFIVIVVINISIILIIAVTDPFS